YNRLPATLPSGETVAGSLTKKQKKTRAIRCCLEGAGLSEAISYALTSEEKSRQFTTGSSKLTYLDWPMTSERTVLRLNLISGLLDDDSYNIARNNHQIALYEIGRIFQQKKDPKENLPQEIEHLAFALAGEWTSRDWREKAVKVDFYQAKGILEDLFNRLNIANQISYQATSEIKEMHPGRCAAILLNGEKIGFVGQVHPKVAKKYEIIETYVAELDLTTLLSAESNFTYTPVTRYPTVSRDIAMVVKEEIDNQTLVQTIKKAAGKYLHDVTLFDVYQGKNIARDYKSMAYGLT